MKITIKLKQPKQRNLIARAVLDPNGLFRAKSERDRSKFNRKVKHRNQEQ
jgi:hypothetical protein